MDDLADGLILLMNKYSSPGYINIGTGEDISILNLADLLKSVIGFDGVFSFDTSKPDGTPRKLLDIHRIKRLDWSPTVSLREGLERTYDWFLKNI